MLEGRVLLNGVAAKPGDRYQTGDRVVLDGRDVGQRLTSGPLGKVLAYHKPQGQRVQADAAASDAEPDDPNSESVMERLPAIRGSRWVMINTMQPGDSGLLLLTTDGRLADGLRRRSEQIGSAYMTRVLVPAPDFDVTTLGLRVRYGEEDIEFTSIEPAGGEGTNRWFKVNASHAHRRAAVRAWFDSHGLTVSRVIQLRFGPIELPRDLPRGKHRTLDTGQVDQLYQLAELQQPVRSEAKPGRKPTMRRAKNARRGGRKPDPSRGPRR